MDLLKIESEKWSEVDQVRILDFIINEWKKKGSSLTFEQLQRWFQRLDLDIPPISIQALRNEKLIGWLLLIYHSEEEAEINPWLLNGHPICNQNLNNIFDIAKSLIEKALMIILTSSVTRVEINFKNNVLYNLDLNHLYTALGFHLLEENCHMRLNLIAHKTQQEMVSNKYVIKRLTDIDEKELFDCYTLVFRNSADKWMLDKSNQELKQYFDEVIINSRFKLISDVSIAILDNDKVIAFSVIRESHGEANAHIWIMGVHPEYRKQGLGRSMINYTKKLLPTLDYKSLSLNVDLSNLPAIRLYESQGFLKDWIQTNYTWKKS